MQACGKEAAVSSSGRSEGQGAAAQQASDVRLADVLGFQLARAAVHTTAVFFQAAGEPLDLRPVEYTALALIQESPGLTPARLAEALSVSAPNITVLLARLEKRGFVLRHAHATDRRAQVLTLTESGAQLAVDATKRITEAERAAFASLSRGELFMLNELLCKLATTHLGS